MKKCFLSIIMAVSVLAFVSHDSDAAMGDIINSFMSPGVMGNRGLAWDGTNLWNSDMFTNTIYKLNPIDGSVITSFAAPSLNTFDLTFVGSDMWNIDIFTRSFYSVDPSVGPPWTLEFTKGSNDFDGLAYDGSNLWSSDALSGGDIIVKMDLNGNVIDSFSSPGSGPQGLAWDGQYLWNGDALTDTIYKIDPNTGAVVASFPAPGPDTTGLAFDGQHLWVSDVTTGMITEFDLGYTPAPPGAVTLLSMLGGMGGWVGVGRFIKRRNKEPKKNKAA